MLLRWKQITEIHIDRQHNNLPAASLRIFHPFDFPVELITKRPYLGLSAVLTLPFSSSIIMSYLTEQNALSLASFIIDREKLNPHRTAFVFDLRSIFESHFRQLFFEWREDFDNSRIETVWSAHRIITKNIFRKKDLNNFIEADPELFNKYYERILKVESSGK